MDKVPSQIVMNGKRYNVAKAIHVSKTSASYNDLRGSVKEWYVKAYPTDELGHEIEEEVTFKDVVLGLNLRRDIYDVLGAGDSCVRERVFEKVAKILDCPYDTIYDLWMADIVAEPLEVVKSAFFRHCKNIDPAVGDDSPIKAVVVLEFDGHEDSSIEERSFEFSSATSKYFWAKSMSYKWKNWVGTSLGASHAIIGLDAFVGGEPKVKVLMSYFV